MAISRTKMQEDLNFTKEQGLEIQKKDILTWAKIIDAETMGILLDYMNNINMQATDGFGVIRGEDIGRLLACIVYGYEDKQIMSAFVK